MSGYRVMSNYLSSVLENNNIKQNNLTFLFANISKTISATSNSFLLIMSQEIMRLHISMHFRWTAPSSYDHKIMGPIKYGSSA